MNAPTFLAAAALAAAGSFEAHAQTFDGPYLGAEIAYESFPDGLDGAVYGLVAGWDVSMADGWLIGVEGRLAAPDISDVEIRQAAGFTNRSTVKLDNQIGLSARLGRRVTPDVLIFATGGFEQFDVDATVIRTPLPPCTICAPTTTDFSFEEELWTLGGGIEWAFSDNMRARAVYTYGEGDAYERNRLSLGVIYGF